MTYATELATREKELVLVWDFPTQDARFANQLSGFSASTYSNLFLGAEQVGESGSKFEIFDGRLTVGEITFRVPDKSGAVHAWLVANDATIAQTIVERREGVIGSDISEWPVSYWVLEDYSVDNAGAFEFRCTNVLAPLSTGLFADFDGESWRMKKSETEVLTTLDPDGTVIFLEKDPTEGTFRSTGYLFLWSEQYGVGELVKYTTITGSPTNSISGLTRGVFGVGLSTAGPPPEGLTWYENDCQIYHVWARRSDPVEFVLNRLFTNPTATGTDVAEPAAQLLSEPRFDSWPLSAWTVAFSGGGGAEGYSEETVDVLGESALRCTFDGGSVDVTQTITDPTPNKIVFLTAYFKWLGPGDCTLEYALENLATSNWYTKSASGRGSGGTWGAVRVNNALGADISGALATEDGWVRFFAAITLENGASTDDYKLYLHATPSAAGASGSLLVDSSDLRGFYDTEPVNGWDDGTGDGIGIDERYVNIDKWNSIRAEYFPDPVYDSATGDRTSGIPFLFVEKEPISDLKIFLEESVLRGAGLWSLVDREEKYTTERYFRVPIIETQVGGNWRHPKFAIRWKRDLLRRLNFAAVETDFNPGLSDPALTRQYESVNSVTKYKRAKVRTITMRGGRTGLHGFPNYDSQTTGDTVARLLFLEAAVPSGEMRLPVFYKHRDVAIGESINADIRGLPDTITGERDTLNAIFVILSKKVVHARGYVDLTLRRHRSILRAAFVAPDSVASTYSSASAADKQHAYIAPDDGFSDGTEPYTVN